MTDWKKPDLGDMTSLADFLAREEYRCVTLSEHMTRRFSLGGATARAKFGGSGLCWLHHGEAQEGSAEITVDGAVFVDSNAASWCLLPREGGEIADLARRFVASSRLASLSGPGEDVTRLCALFGRPPLAERHYDLMKAKAGIPTPSKSAGVEIRRASMRDIAALCSLHGAYEEEELPKALRFRLPSLPERMVGLLRRQVVVLAFMDGRAVGKANTNARGLRTDQLGGIYVRPEARNKGVGTLMVSGLSAILRDESRGICLYVRPDNRSAKRMYAKLGFVDAGSYAAYHF
ncbi:MAG TPA: GNAT family N-acetyltransferase [Rectinemataceae bacterium]|nr:GNAT family N-acetyltransferase [Rectinemataceae bacterium]